MDAKEMQMAVYDNYAQEQEKSMDTRVKKSFWASDCLKPRNELYWAWTNVPKTNVPSPEKLAMFDVGKLCELHLIRELVKVGIAADMDLPTDVLKVEAKIGETIHFSDKPDEFGHKQIRMEMEREFCPWSGYLDGITLNGEPIEVKSTRSTKYIRDVATGRPPQIEHVYQLATYMDFIGAKVGWLAVTARADGALFFVKVEHLGDLVYQTTDHSLGLPEEMQNDDAPAQKIEIEPLTIDLGAEYKRCRKLFEDHIHTLKEPPLEFEYRPAVTKELLDSYPEDKIKAAIKGRRVLSEHGWKPQYCDWRDLWIERECENKGIANPNELMEYNSKEIQFMLDYLDAELIDGTIRKITDTRRKQLIQETKDGKRKEDPSLITDQRRKNGIEDRSPLCELIPKKAAEFLRVGLGVECASDLDAVADSELLSIPGIGAGAVEKIRAATFTFDPPEWK